MAKNIITDAERVAKNIQVQRKHTPITKTLTIDPLRLQHVCHYAVFPCSACCYEQGLIDAV
jgi:hypothetical protein